MAEDQKKLNSMRLLENQGIAYETFTYDPAIQDGVHVAEAMGQPVEQVFKTLVVQLGKGDHALVMIPSNATLDLKKFARSIGEKKASMTTQRGAEAATGLRKGGIGALALTHKRWGVYLDQSARKFDAILINGGERGVNLKLGVDDLIRVLNAREVDAIEESGGADQ